jgi:ribosomal protein S18 acetylase RimI-like enzyme
MELSLETPSPPSTNLSIRPATAADIPSLCELDAQCFPHSFTFSAERFLDLLQDEQYRVFVMKNEQHLIGKAHLAFKPNHTTRLSDVAIHPAWQRQGHGRSLVTQCLHYARNLYPNAPITLNVNAKNQHAIALYQDIGFARTNTVDYWTQSSQILQAHLRQRR